MITLTRAMITQKGYPQIAQIAQITEGWGRHPATVRRHPDYINPLPHRLDRVGVGTVRRQGTCAPTASIAARTSGGLCTAGRKRERIYNLRNLRNLRITPSA
jgi:hypothetical protein